MSVESLAARGYKLEHARRVWVIEPDFILFELRREPVAAQLITNVDGGRIIFFRAGDVWLESQPAQVFARGFLIRNGAKLIFPATLGGGALGAEAVDAGLCERLLY